MEREALLEHLRRKGEEKIGLLWREAEEKAHEQRQAASRTLAEQKELSAAEFSARLDLQAQRRVAEAKRQAGQRRTESYGALAARLWQLAAANLHHLRDENYQQVFAQLVQELPAHAWETVIVHPGDEALAVAAFPGAAIATDSRITGGFEVSGEQGRVRIVNTLDKRLERAWPELLPVLMQAIAAVEPDETTAL